MKKATVIGLLSCLVSVNFAQQNSGKIIFEESMDLKEMIANNEQLSAFADMMPTELTFNNELLFSSTETLYRPGKEEPQKAAEGMQIEMEDKPDTYVYTNLESSKTVQQENFMGRKFLITSDKAEKQKWKLENVTKEIAGYACRRATMKDDKGEEVVAWYAPKLQISSGPKGYGQLPGMILKLETRSDSGPVAITAKDIQLGVENEIKPPKKGKKVTKEQFDKIVREKMEEFKEAREGEGNKVIIKTEER